MYERFEGKGNLRPLEFRRSVRGKRQPYDRTAVHGLTFLLPQVVKNDTVPKTVGESVMNTAMALEVLDNYGELLALAGAPSAAHDEVLRLRKNLEQALWAAAWNATAGQYRAGHDCCCLGWLNRLI